MMLIYIYKYIPTYLNYLQNVLKIFILKQQKYDTVS